MYDWRHGWTRKWDVRGEAMNGCRRSMPALLLLLLAMQSAANAEDRIGVAASTRPSADGIVGANAQTLSPGSEVYANETVRTGNRGLADLVLLDATNLIVGSTSEVLLDTFVYDRTGSSGSVVVQATRGTLQLVTGSQDQRAYQVNTPYGSLGVSESMAALVPSPHSSGASLSYAEQNDFGGTTNGGGTTVEIVVKPKGQKRGLCQNGRPAEYGKPCEVECEVVARLVKGTGASFTSLKGKRAEFKHPGDVVCITPNGDIVHSTSTESLLAFETAPGVFPTIAGTQAGGNIPVTTPTCMSPTTLECR
jgi:hypothetical protein